ncbi:protein MpLOS2 [Marchantia polymorpha subsp. ruderalis]|uniref:ALOG domain-containing protein n=1 Tax=Marchantia polymorpha TaxID=3197 RepID=A0A2R6VZT1_MARPO|nr:hypothetical protein MARPO_0221s0004 [Marchantia polymorpha]BBN03574.1 hypothetical protein Mp_2g24600 [Marchantia polymorpha subsp. ruderalis]|eukprot:PTQ27109.1 hypothetical protein MARPO_0221s0004 [Marchantia polymorpha]
MDSLFRFSNESSNAAASGGAQGRDEAKVEYLGPTTFEGAGSNELEVFQQQQLRGLNQKHEITQSARPPPAPPAAAAPSRYESQKRRDWNSFGQYLRNHRPRIDLEECSGEQVIEFLRYLDQFGKTKVHVPSCHYFGVPSPAHPCSCPLRQAWGSLDALIGRLRAAFEENGGHASRNPFGDRVIRSYLREVREKQAKARGIAYGKKKKGLVSSQPSLLPVPTEQEQQQQQQQLTYEHHQHHHQHLLPQMPAHIHHGSLSDAFSIHDAASSSGSQGYQLASYNPSNGAVSLVSRVYPPFEIHSFMEDLPCRDASGWAWNPVCG